MLLFEILSPRWLKLVPPENVWGVRGGGLNGIGLPTPLASIPFLASGLTRARIVAGAANYPVVWMSRAILWMLRAMVCMLRATVWMLMAVVWMLRAMVWMFRVMEWTLRAVVWMLRAMVWTLRTMVWMIS